MKERFVKPHEFKLENGLRVVYTHYPHLSSFSISMMGRAGSMYETPETAGVAHFLEHVVFDGTEKYPNEIELSTLLDSVGGSSNAATGNEYVRYYASTLAEDATKTFEHISEVVLHPLLKETSIKKQQLIITEEINMYLSDPSSFAFDKMMEAMYPDSRLGGLITGTASEVLKIDREKIDAYRKERYSANNFVLSVCGPLSEKKVRELSAEYFSEMPRGRRTSVPKPKSSKGFHVDARRWKDLKQTTLLLGYPAPSLESKKRYAWAILSFILGSGQLSRLFSSIREKHNLTYYIGSNYSAGPGYGHLYVYTGLNEKNISKFINAYKEEVDKLVREGITENEYKRALSNFRASLLYKSDSTSGTASTYAYDRLFGKEKDAFPEKLKKYERVTLDEVHRAAKELFAEAPKVSAIGKNIKKSDFDPLK